MSILDQSFLESKSVECIICKTSTISLIPICAPCRDENKKKETNTIRDIEMFNRSNKFNTPEMIADAVGITVAEVKWYLQKGKIVPAGKRCIDNGERSGISMTASRFGKFIFIEVGGRIDSNNAGALQKYIDSLINDGWKDIVLDMSTVKYFSSIGIRVVLATYKTLYESGSFSVFNPSENAANVLGMVALDKMLLKSGT